MFCCHGFSDSRHLLPKKKKLVIAARGSVCFPTGLFTACFLSLGPHMIFLCQARIILCSSLDDSCCPQDTKKTLLNIRVHLKALLCSVNVCHAWQVPPPCSSFQYLNDWFAKIITEWLYEQSNQKARVRFLVGQNKVCTILDWYLTLYTLLYSFQYTSL